jgi:predicted enzyme related to lactoylglutathione lyase
LQATAEDGPSVPHVCPQAPIDDCAENQRQTHRATSGGGMNFNNVLIGSEDPARLVEYYTKLFGDPKWSDGGYTTWLLGSGAISVGPHSEVKGRNASPGRLILNIETDDVQGDFARWRDAGATVIREPYTFDEAPGSWIATFADPDDNYFQLMTPMPEALG